MAEQLTSTPNKQTKRSLTPNGSQSTFNEELTPIKSSNTLLAEDYERSVSRITGNQFITLRQLRSDATQCNATDDQLSGGVVNVYGIVNSVTNINTIHKKVEIIDPTNCEGFRFIINNILLNIVIKNIVRLTNVSLITFNGNKVYAINEVKNFAQFNAFTYDYDNENELSLHFSTAIDNLESDRHIVKLLEEWFARKFMDENSFNKFPSPTVISSPKYADFICMVIASRLMMQSIQLTIYDGHKPNFLVEDQYNSNFQNEKISNSYFHLNENVFSNTFNASYFAYVNIWKNKSSRYNDHYEIGYWTSLQNGDDLLIFFNVEVMCGTCDDSIKLVMRSGRHHGKAVRKVKRNSILGKLFMSSINNERLREATTNPIINTSFQIPAENSLNSHSLIGSHITNIQKLPECQLISYGSRKLQAMIDQQSKQKAEPLFIGNKYVSDLKSLNGALNTIRQLTKFPFVSVTKFFKEVDNLNEVLNDSTMNDLIIIRCKLINIFPKSVFPQNDFIHLKCDYCHFQDTYKSYVSTRLPLLSSSDVYYCPHCRGNNSLLNYTYAIKCMIKDRFDCLATALIADSYGFNIFGIKANQVLFDKVSAIRVDNILFEMQKKSEHNYLNWILKPCQTHFLVINILPLSE